MRATYDFISPFNKIYKANSLKLADQRDHELLKLQAVKHVFHGKLLVHLPEELEHVLLCQIETDLRQEHLHLSDAHVPVVVEIERPEVYLVLVVRLVEKLANRGQVNELLVV